MFGDNKTYFADAPVIIDISGLAWPTSSPFNIVHLGVIHDGVTVGNYNADTGGQDRISFDVSSALRAIWGYYNFLGEVQAAQAALDSVEYTEHEREMREYSLHVTTEYMSDDGEFQKTDGGTFSGGQCLLGGLTEWERSLITNAGDRDVSHLEHTGIRFGDASTKPISSPEHVGSNSITSWVDVKAGYTRSVFYPSTYNGGHGEPDDIIGQQEGWEGHAPLVLRDNIPYTDFLFVNRRGAVETCSAIMKEAMSMSVESKQYARVERPTFAPSRDMMAINTGGRRSWSMSSGPQTREWAEWWTSEFLMARRVWMLYKGVYTPVVVTPSKNNIGIYDLAQQQMLSVEFTVTLALEG